MLYPYGNSAWASKGRFDIPALRADTRRRKLAHCKVVGLLQATITGSLARRLLALHWMLDKRTS